MAVLKYYNTATSAWEYIAASTTANFTSWKKTMAGGETSVSGTDDNAVTLSYTVGLEQVFINGVLQVRGSDYTATTGTSITDLTALVAGDIVTVVCYAPFNVANTIAPTVVDAKGDLIAGTGADAVGRLAVGTNDYTLVADSTTSTGLKWKAPWTKVANGNFPSASSVTISSLTGNNFFIYAQNWSSTSNAVLQIRINGNAGSNYVPFSGDVGGAVTLLTVSGTITSGSNGYNGIFIPATSVGTAGKFVISGNLGGIYNDPSPGAITSITLIASAGNFDAGAYEVWSD
jgi:hypothetical protein